MSAAVWMPTGRHRPRLWHDIEGRQTTCGIPIGDPAAPLTGAVLDGDEARGMPDASHCARCSGEWVPTVPWRLPWRTRPSSPQHRGEAVAAVPDSRHRPGATAATPSLGGAQ